MTTMSPLRRRMIEDMTVRNPSLATQRNRMCDVVAKGFGRFFGRSPDKLGLEDVRTFQVHLVAGRDIVAGAEPDGLRASFSAWGNARAQSDLPERIPYAREPQKLPVVLGADEVRALPRSGAEPGSLVLFALDHGICGRIAIASEAACLKVANIVTAAAW